MLISPYWKAMRASRPASRPCSAATSFALQGLLAERDARIRFQYGEISKLMTMLRSHEKGLAGYLAFLARKAYARLKLLRGGG